MVGDALVYSVLRKIYLCCLWRVSHTVWRIVIVDASLAHAHFESALPLWGRERRNMFDVDIPAKKNHA